MNRQPCDYASPKLGHYLHVPYLNGIKLVEFAEYFVQKGRGNGEWTPVERNELIWFSPDNYPKSEITLNSNGSYTLSEELLERIWVHENARKGVKDHRDSRKGCPYNKIDTNKSYSRLLA
jgi:hypothetical protein